MRDVTLRCTSRIWLYMALDQLLRLSNSKQNWYLTGTYSAHEHHENRHATLGISMEIVFL